MPTQFPMPPSPFAPPLKSRRSRTRKPYWIESASGWFVINAFNQRGARSAAVQQEGRGMVRQIRPATPAEIKAYRTAHGDPEEV